METGAGGEEVRTEVTTSSNLLLTTFECLVTTLWKFPAFEKLLQGLILMEM